MENNNIHIAIEGMDGVGKTTVSIELSKMTGFKFIEKPLHYLFDKDNDFTNYIKIRDRINNLKDDHILRAWFYGLGNIWTSHMFNENIITDRHLLSNYYWCGGEEKNTEDIFNLLIDLIGFPDYTFLLTASIDEGLKRMKNRNSNDSDLHKIELYDNANVKMTKFLKKHEQNCRYKIIDTTNLSVEQVVDKIVITLKNTGLIK